MRRHYPDAPILRPSVVFGPEDDFFNRFAQLAQLAPAVPLVGGGHTRFQPVYVGDVADAVLRALDSPEASGRIYELGGPRTMTFAGGVSPASQTRTMLSPIFRPRQERAPV